MANLINELESISLQILQVWFIVSNLTSRTHATTKVSKVEEFFCRSLDIIFCPSD